MSWRVVRVLTMPAMRVAVMLIVWLLTAWLLMAVSNAGVGAEPVAPPLVSAPLDAKEVKELKAIYAEAAKVDVWTALQIEAWCEANPKAGFRPQPILGAQSLVIGEPLFACPSPIITLRDSGDAVTVVTGRRLHRFRPDGRPLARSVPLPLDAGGYVASGTIGFDTSCAGLLQRRSEGLTMQFYKLIAMGLDGSVRVAGEVVLGARSTHRQVQVANDGSAVAVALSDAGATWVQVQHGNVPGKIDGDDVVGIGPEASWLLVRDNGSEVAVRGTQRTPLSSSAIGPGMLAGIDAGNTTTAWLATAKGEVVPLTISGTLGPQAKLLTVGRWLVLTSGVDGALGDADVLDPAARGNRMALWRWKDLVADPHAPPALILTHPCEHARTREAGLYLWHGDRVEWLDLSGNDPVVRPLATLSMPVNWVSENAFRTRVNLPDQQCVVLDDQGRELWRGRDSAMIFGQQWLLETFGTGDKSSYTVTRLALKEAERKTVPLELPAGAWNFRDDAGRSRLLAVHADKSWNELDLDSGRSTRRGLKMDPLPYFAWPVVPEGRFYAHYGRIFTKAEGEFGPQDTRVHPLDAWLFTGTSTGVVILGVDERVTAFLPGRRDLTALGACPNATHIMLLSNEQPVFADVGNRPLATVGAKAGKWELLTSVDSNKLVNPSPGPWRLSGNRNFAPPGSGSRVWDEDKAGFEPLRLRSPKGDAPLVVVTTSLVIAIDRSAADHVSSTPGKK